MPSTWKSQANAKLLRAERPKLEARKAALSHWRVECAAQRLAEEYIDRALKNSLEKAIGIGSSCFWSYQSHLGTFWQYCSYRWPKISLSLGSSSLTIIMCHLMPNADA